MPENVKELEVKLDEKEEEKEVEVEKNPLEKLQEETKAEPITEELAEEVIKEEKKVEEPKKEVPKYSSEMPYSEKVRKRIAKEVGKRADAERKALQWEEKFNTLEGKARSGLKTGFKNNYENVSKQMKSAIDEGNTEEPLPPLAKEWAAKNAGWFNKPGHTKATSLVYGIDGELTEEGWDVHDPGYYEEIDKRLKATLPSFFDKKTVQEEKSGVQSKTTRVQSPVASVSRTKSGSSNRVKLTQDDLDTAKSFGIDINDETALKRFAREVKNLSDTGQQ